MLAGLEVRGRFPAGPPRSYDGRVADPLNGVRVVGAAAGSEGLYP